MDIDKYLDIIPVDYDLNSKDINPFIDFSDYAFWAFDKVIYYNEDADKWLINPEYHRILKESDMGPEKSGLDSFDWNELYNMLTLEAARRNASRDKTKNVIDRLYGLLCDVVDPILSQQVNDVFDALTYFKEKDASLDEISSELNNKEDVVNKQKEIKEKFGHLNFAKK